MYKKTIGDNTTIYPDADDLIEVIRKPQLSDKKAEIATTVYGIIYGNVSYRRTVVGLRKFFLKNIENTHTKILSILDKNIEQKKIGIIFEKIIIEYFLNNGMGTTSLINQDTKEGIDFIFKSGNIKIGTDITIRTNRGGEDIKKQKIVSNSYLIDDPEKTSQIKVGIGRQVDVQSLLYFYLPENLKVIIYQAFHTWKKNKYNNHWSNYVWDNELNEINQYFECLVGYIKSFLRKIFIKQDLSDINISHNCFEFSGKYNNETDVYSLIIRENGRIILDFFIPFTQKLVEKLGIEKNIKREKLEKNETQENNLPSTLGETTQIEEIIEEITYTKKETHYRDRKKRGDKIKRRKSEENDKINLLIEEQDFPNYLVKNQIMKVLK